MRHSTGGVRKQRGRWLGLWYEDGIKKSKVLGLCSDMTKSEARAAVAKIVGGLKCRPSDVILFGGFVEGAYFDFYSRKWKLSTCENNKQRIRTHLVAEYNDRALPSFKRDELQDLLDTKACKLSFSVVDHLRWDLKQIFDMAIAEGHIKLNPALLLFTPKAATRPIRNVMSIEQVSALFEVLEPRERLIAKLAVLAGMRPGEIFGLTLGRLAETYAEVVQRVYRGHVDTPKTDHSVRQAALGEGLLAELDSWRWKYHPSPANPAAYVFPSEKGTALSKDNVWHRNMQPKLATLGLGWCNFQVMRRTHATLMRLLKADPKMVADQLGHSVDVSLNVYTQSPVDVRLPLVNQLENLVIN